MISVRSVVNNLCAESVADTMTENPYQPPRASSTSDDVDPIPSVRSAIVFVLRMVAATLLGTVIGSLVGLWLFGLPFGMGDDGVLVERCALLGAIGALMFEIHRIRRRQTTSAEPSLAWKAGNAVRQFLNLWT